MSVLGPLLMGRAVEYINLISGVQYIAVRDLELFFEAEAELQSLFMLIRFLCIWYN